MASWAIVIGIDQYWSATASLKGAVRDALRMREWLTNVDGGAVPRANQFLLLGPAPSSPIPDGLTYTDANKDTIVKTIARLIDRSQGQGERLYFHFSGHGLTSRITFSDEQALVTADFTDQLTDNSLSLRSVLEYFQATQFEEQYFFIDACRNIPWEGEFEIGKLPRPRRRDPSLPPVQQFVCYATSPGIKAIEIREAGNERGAFTDALLQGLNGTDSAKSWDDSGQYLVRWEDLFAYVEGTIISQRLAVADRSAIHYFQVPRQAGERGSLNPILGRFAADAFPDVSLDVVVDPLLAAPETEISVSDLDNIDQRLPATVVPVHFSLPPREYIVRAQATNYEPEQRRWRVELYQSGQQTIRLRPRAIPQPTLPVTPEEIRTDLSSFTTSLVGPRTLESLSASAHLTVQSSDLLGALEVADRSGAIIATGIGTLECPDLAPGFYRARLRTPEGAVVEQVVDLSEGEVGTLHLSSPKRQDSPLVRDIIEHANFSIHADNTLDVSETIGPMVSPQLSTILTLAGTVMNQNTPWGHRLRDVGLTSFRDSVAPNSESGLQILFGTEYGSAADHQTFLKHVTMRLWPEQRTIPKTAKRPTRIPSSDGLAQYSWAKPPGRYWLAMQLPQQKPTIFPVTIMPRRLTLLVIHCDAVGQIHVYQYLPALVGAEQADLDYRRPPEVAHAEMLRRLELMQRFYMSGQLQHAYENAKELLYAKWEEPIAGCLGGYLMLRLGKPDELQIAAGNMTAFFGQLSDSHVLMGEYLASQKQFEVQAIQSFRSALDYGLPIFADGMARLVSAVQHYHIDHPRVGLLLTTYEARVPGLLWSAWVPRTFAPGIPVEVAT